MAFSKILNKLYVPTPAEIREYSAGDTRQKSLMLSVTQLKLNYGELPVLAFGVCSAVFNGKPTNFLKVLVIVNAPSNECYGKLLFATKGIHDNFMQWPNQGQFPCFLTFTEQKTKSGQTNYFKVDYMPVPPAQKHMWLEQWERKDKTISYPEGVKQVVV